MTVYVSSKPADGASRLPAAAWLVLGTVLVADIMDLLDATITTIAAPTISSSLHGGPGLIKWLGASYALALGVLLVPGGRLGDKYGRRRTFLIGITGFTAASLACGLAWDPPSIIVARLVQGAFGALLIPQGFGILGSVFPREHIGKAFSAFGPILGLSAVGGPLLAGLLIDANLFGLGWRPMFLINIVLGAAGLAAGLRLLPHDAGDRAVSIDALGSALLAACMLGLLFGLIQGSTDGWTAAPVAALAAGVIFFAAFAQRQRTAAAPLIKPSLLRNQGFTAGLILGLVFFATVAGLLYAVSLFLQRGVGYSPERAAVTGFCAGRCRDRHRVGGLQEPAHQARPPAQPGRHRGDGGRRSRAGSHRGALRHGGQRGRARPGHDPHRPGHGRHVLHYLRHCHRRH